MGFTKDSTSFYSCVDRNRMGYSSCIARNGRSLYPIPLANRMGPDADFMQEYNSSTQEWNGTLYRNRMGLCKESNSISVCRQEEKRTLFLCSPTPFQ